MRSSLRHVTLCFQVKIYVGSWINWVGIQRRGPCYRHDLRSHWSWTLMKSTRD